MDAKHSTNLLIIISVTAALSWLIDEDKTAPVSSVVSAEVNTLITQKIFRQCGNSPDTNLTCIKLVDDLAQGVITRDDFLNYIKHAGADNHLSENTLSNSL